MVKYLHRLITVASFTMLVLMVYTMITMRYEYGEPLTITEAGGCKDNLCVARSGDILLYTRRPVLVGQKVVLKCRVHQLLADNCDDYYEVYPPL